jgi:SAM-dependent methyltransferase
MPEQGLQASSDEWASRRRFETEGVYSSRTICRKLQNEARDYIDELLADKLDTIRAHIQPGMLVDLCCATGGHLLDLSGLVKEAVGIDFSQPYIAKAQQDAAEQEIPNVRFVVGNAKALPLRDQSIGTLYSLSSLYVIPNVEDVLAELNRVLKPGGRAILDLQNSWSLNAFCVRHYADIAPTFPMSVGQMRSLILKNNFLIVEHRAFQILPLWAGKPDWLWPLLHPGWKRVMKHRLKGRMIDEWISNSWLLKRFAARHLIVVEKAQ